ncbi:Extracellular membrane protein, CFEM domain protein [Metarhizium album ARSEF 1941]|uniref:Extracellular membrane protein, CFEM domain protein n=1 Tax=Metarhizium album (strain ARSEF 1941) TaxID=1081103 RepID=A0A0B2WRM9_METAS|nr:Extracellular membrane protein, CFEM domain protein [Metarhizium album ARSEF 1941]KHN96157.1 Extracellular membrane protein, CFEM domain protein [Metarhizium album ARSEF 1941]
MGRLLPLFLGVFGTLRILAVSAQSAPACVETCTNNVRNKFADLKCPDASAAPCFCTNPIFYSAILECSKPQCGATADNVSTYLSTHFCTGQPLPKSDDTAAPTSAASQTPTSSAPATTAETTPATSPATTTSATVTPTTTSAAVETTRTSTTSSSTSSSTSSTSGSATSSNPAAQGSSSKGLPQAAIAGICVGVGTANIAIAGIVICMLLKSRRRRPSPSGNHRAISKPSLGPDRMYPQHDMGFRRDGDRSMEKYGNDLEMTSHRYEDMVPRTQPRTLV